MIKKNSVQIDEMKEPEEKVSSSMAKSVYYIVASISLERFCTAGILSMSPLYIVKIKVNRTRSKGQNEDNEIVLIDENSIEIVIILLRLF